VQDRLDRNEFRLVSMWTFSRFYSRLTDTRYNVIFHLKVIFKRNRRARACNSDRRIGAVRRDAAIAERTRRERAAGRSLVARSIPDDLRKPVSNRWIRSSWAAAARNHPAEICVDQRANLVPVPARFALSTGLVLRTLNDYITVTPITKPHAVSNILKDLINR